MSVSGGRTVRLEVAAKVEGQPRPRVSKGVVYSPRCKYREAVRDAWKAGGFAGFGESPVLLVVRTHRRRPSGKDPEDDAYRPDIDNILKAVMDGLQDAKAYADDKQVVGAYILKCPRVRMGQDEEEWTEIEVSEWVTTLEDER